MYVVECIQNSDEWLEARRGVPSASSFDRIMTPKKCELSKQADDYIAELIAEEHHLEPLKPSFLTSQAIQDGVDREPEARRWYTYETGNEVAQVGFCLDNEQRFGCSPDGLIGLELGEQVDNWHGLPCYRARARGSLELKNPTLKTHTKYLLDGKLPDDYLCQVHGHLIVCGVEWTDFASYAPGLPALNKKAVHDAYTLSVRTALILFWERFQIARAKIEAMR